MSNFICTTCGTQFAESSQPPEECKICTDERQCVGWSGQQWTTHDGLRQSHRNVVRLEELGLYGIGMEPSFAIGQRAYTERGGVKSSGLMLKMLSIDQRIVTLGGFKVDRCGRDNRSLQNDEMTILSQRFESQHFPNCYHLLGGCTAKTKIMLLNSNSD